MMNGNEQAAGALRDRIPDLPIGFLGYDQLVRALHCGLLTKPDDFGDAEGIKWRDELDSYVDKDGGASIELRLGDQYYVTGSDGPKYLTDSEDVLVIPPGQFALLTTYETVHMFSDTLALISIKFRIKQKGLVNVSGFHVDPGYFGRIQYSVFNAGPTDLMLERRQPLFQMFVNALSEPTSRPRKKTKVGKMSVDSFAQLAGRTVSLRSLEQRVSRMEQMSQIYITLIVALIAAVVAILLTNGH